MARAMPDPRAMARRASRRPRRTLSLVRPRVLLITEGTYPYAVGGVSSWCDLLVHNLTEFEWQVLPIIGAHGRPPLFELPAHAREVGRIELWSEGLARGGRVRRGQRGGRRALPGALVPRPLGWGGGPAGA